MEDQGLQKVFETLLEGVVVSSQARGEALVVESHLHLSLVFGVVLEEVSADLQPKDLRAVEEMIPRFVALVVEH